MNQSELTQAREMMARMMGQGDDLIPLPTPADKIEGLTKDQRSDGLALLLCLAIVAADNPQGEQFMIVADRIAQTVSDGELRLAKFKGSLMASNLRACLDAAT